MNVKQLDLWWSRVTLAHLLQSHFSHLQVVQGGSRDWKQDVRAKRTKGVTLLENSTSALLTHCHKHASHKTEVSPDISYLLTAHYL